LTDTPLTPSHILRSLFNARPSLAAHSLSHDTVASVSSAVPFADSTVPSPADVGIYTTAYASAVAAPLATAPLSVSTSAVVSATSLVVASTAAAVPVSTVPVTTASIATVPRLNPIVVDSVAAPSSAGLSSSASADFLVSAVSVPAAPGLDLATGHPLSRLDQLPLPRTGTEFKIQDLPACVNHGSKQTEKYRYSSLVSFHAFLAGLLKPDGTPKLKNIKEVYTFPEFQATIDLLSASPISDVGVQYKWGTYLKNLKGQPSTKGNKLRGVRWWLLYSFLRQDLDISENALTLIWEAGAIAFHKLNKTTEHKLNIRNMTGPIMFKLYYKIRVKMNAQLLELAAILLPYITHGHQLPRQSEKFAITVLATALLVLNITPRFQAVSRLLSFRSTPDPNASDISALMVDPDDWAQLRFVLFGGKGKDHHQLESTPLPSTLSQLLIVWDSYSSQHLSETKSKLFFSNSNKDNPISDLADWVRDNFVENLEMKVEDPPNGVNHYFRNICFSTYVSKVKGEPSLVAGVANLAHSSLNIFDEVYAVHRDSLWKETVSASYFREMKLIGPVSELPPLLPPPLPEIVSNPPAVSLFAYKNMTKILFGEESVGPLTDLTDSNSEGSDLPSDEKAEAVSCCFKCASCEAEFRGHKQQLALLRSILRVDKSWPTVTIASSITRQSEVGNPEQPNGSSSSSNISSTSSTSTPSSSTSSSRSISTRTSSNSSSTSNPRLDWTATLVDFVCQRRANNVSFRDIATAAQHAGLIPLGQHQNAIKSYYNNIIKKSTSQILPEEYSD
jgi:hypothetical protein